MSRFIHWAKLFLKEAKDRNIAAHPQPFGFMWQCELSSAR